MSASPSILSPNPNPNPNSDDWTIVSSRRRRRSSAGTLTLSLAPTPTSIPSPWIPADRIINPTRSADLLRKIRSTIQRLERSKFYSHFISLFKSDRIQNGLSRIRLSDPGSDPDPIRIVVYGIGSFESYPAPRLQLALVELIRRQLGADVASAEIFDPVLSATECHVAVELGFEVMLKNEHGRRKVKEPTIFFMPHCEAELYNSLLETNFRPSDLNRMVLIGNSFSQYSTYVSHAGKLRGGSVRIERVAKCLLEIERRKFVREIEVELGIEGEMELGVYEAFHDMSWHFFELDGDVDLGSDLLN